MFLTLVKSLMYRSVSHPTTIKMMEMSSRVFDFVILWGQLDQRVAMKMMPND
jgi:hypothetical protein